MTTMSIVIKYSVMKVNLYFLQTELSDIEDLEEDEFESGFEDMKTDEEYEDELDPHSSKFRAQGQLMSYEEEPSFEGYLQVKVCSNSVNSVHLYFQVIGSM